MSDLRNTILAKIPTRVTQKSNTSISQYYNTSSYFHQTICMHLLIFKSSFLKSQDQNHSSTNDTCL